MYIEAALKAVWIEAIYTPQYSLVFANAQTPAHHKGD